MRAQARFTCHRRNIGSPGLRIVGHHVGAHLSLFAGVFGWLSRIIKLIWHAKATDAAQGRSTLLDGKEPAVGAETHIARCVEQRHREY